MVATRVQLRRTLLGQPLLGRWDCYTGACFETADPVPSATVRTLLMRLFSGADAVNNSARHWTTNRYFDTGTNQATLTTWSYDGSWNTEYLEPVTLSYLEPGLSDRITMPMQMGIAFGYRCAPGPGWPAQRGRSRFRFGPLDLWTTMLTGSTISTGGPRLSAAGVDDIVINATSCLTALAAEGWSLVVKSGSGPYTFHPAVECYVDDVLDVQRSRRRWSDYQKREAL